MTTACAQSECVAELVTRGRLTTAHHAATTTTTTTTTTITTTNNNNNNNNKQQQRAQTPSPTYHCFSTLDHSPRMRSGSGGAGVVRPGAGGGARNRELEDLVDDLRRRNEALKVSEWSACISVKQTNTFGIGPPLSAIASFIVHSRSQCCDVWRRSSRLREV